MGRDLIEIADRRYNVGCHPTLPVHALDLTDHADIHALTVKNSKTETIRSGEETLQARGI
jgi:hypothetical protein